MCSRRCFIVWVRFRFKVFGLTFILLASTSVSLRGICDVCGILLRFGGCLVKLRCGLVCIFSRIDKVERFYGRGLEG